jgi:hypothetical protein
LQRKQFRRHLLAGQGGGLNGPAEVTNGAPLVVNFDLEKDRKRLKNSTFFYYSLAFF